MTEGKTDTAISMADFNRAKITQAVQQLGDMSWEVRMKKFRHDIMGKSVAVSNSVHLNQMVPRVAQGADVRISLVPMLVVNSYLLTFQELFPYETEEFLLAQMDLHTHLTESREGKAHRDVETSLVWRRFAETSAALAAEWDKMQWKHLVEHNAVPKDRAKALREEHLNFMRVIMRSEDYEKYEKECPDASG